MHLHYFLEIAPTHLPVGHDAEVDVLGEGGLNGLREEERLHLLVRFLL